MQANITSSDYINHHLINWSVNGFNLDSLIVSWLLGIFFITLFYLVGRRASVKNPSGLQNALEQVVEFVDNTVRDTIKKEADARLIGALSFTLFVWILLMNLMDLIPIDATYLIMKAFGLEYFKLVPTADVNITFGFSVTVFFAIIFFSIKNKGFIGYVKDICSHPFGILMLPVNIVFRIMEDFSRPISLAMRLYGNLFAGEMVFILIATAPPYIQWLFSVPWALFHILIIFLQSYIFMMLTIAYLGMTYDSH